jgi:hypothetical protein
MLELITLSRFITPFGAIPPCNLRASVARTLCTEQLWRAIAACTMWRCTNQASLHSAHAEPGHDESRCLERRGPLPTLLCSETQVILTPFPAIHSQIPSVFPVVSFWPLQRVSLLHDFSPKKKTLSVSFGVHE